jgi:hypothetical protein
MARIFSALALVAVLLLAANLVVGLTAGDFNAAAKRKRDAYNHLIELQRHERADKTVDPTALEKAKQAAAEADESFRGPRARMTLHMLLGSAAALITVLVSSITVTYFIGTTRWCKEVSDAYEIGPELSERSAQLKRSAFPWALAGILTVILVVGLGAAADPSGANWSRSSQFVNLHYGAAMIGLVIIIVAFWMQASRIAENHEVIQKILAEVERIRMARNLPIEESSAR